MQSGAAATLKIWGNLMRRPALLALVAGITIRRNGCFQNRLHEPPRLDKVARR
jgi:hypothetical protein